MRPNDIAIIGAGQIGSRHLQAMALFPEPVQIHLVDPSRASLETALGRFREIKGVVDPRCVHQYLSVEELPDRLDLAIVATGADVRRNAITSLLNRATVPYLILEKFLFQRVEDFHAVRSALETHGVKAWVNCPRRTVAFYQMLRDCLHGFGPAGVTVAGSQIGIGCNAIHYLDLMAFLTGESEFTLSPDYLDPAIHASKRAGFSEFCGHLQGASLRGDRFTLSSFAGGQCPVMIHIATENMACLVREQEGRAWLSRQAKRWAWEEISFSIPFQSQLTHLLVAEILSSGASMLTPYNESVRLHLAILSTLLTHMNRYSDMDASVCPIT